MEATSYEAEPNEEVGGAQFRLDADCQKDALRVIRATRVQEMDHVGSVWRQVWKPILEVLSLALPAMKGRRDAIRRARVIELLE